MNTKTLLSAQLSTIAALLLLVFGTACGALAPEPAATLVVPTAITDMVQALPTAAAPPRATPTSFPTVPSLPAVTATPARQLDPIQNGNATATAMAEQSSPLPTAVPPIASNNSYRVAFVESNDVLNVRSGAGVNNGVVGTLAATDTGITLTGATAQVAGSTWVEMQKGGMRGWVNGRFLTPMLNETAFCSNEAVDELVAALKTAVGNQDSTALARLVHPERGLRVRTSWWNPEVRLSRSELDTIYSSPTSYDWGVHDGSGLPWVGSFTEQIQPMLVQDLLAADESGCNIILHGNTAGLVRLPDGYEAVNFYTLKRNPLPDAIEFDWGSWVIGIEQSDGAIYLSYLVHFAYEI
ncbi:MAG: hypothetical protein KDE56_17510 [Anaerolineales bacterium]|nr:hypothetical protein [Anaerolineales bacterium]